jgi:hypothetical protein
MVNVEVCDEDVFDSSQICQTDSQSVQHTGADVEYDWLPGCFDHEPCQRTVRTGQRRSATKNRDFHAGLASSLLAGVDLINFTHLAIPSYTSAETSNSQDSYKKPGLALEGRDPDDSQHLHHRRS